MLTQVYHGPRPRVVERGKDADVVESWAGSGMAKRDDACAEVGCTYGCHLANMIERS